ncbi:MAG: CatB-related O-acetyltransferase [Chitinophagaceae bacterium]|nr:CatB-related O-acetyltransferase [Chitinophagaceae bacterium]
MISLLKSLVREKDLFWNWNLSRLDNCELHKNTVLNKPHSLRNCYIGKGTAIGPNSRMGDSTIGKFCSIGPNFLAGWGIHPVNGISTSPVFYSSSKQAGFSFSTKDKIREHLPIHIGNDVFIGANVIVLDGISIGDGAVIGAGAVVSKDIPPYAIAVGSPIRVIRYRFEPDVIEKLLEIEWWNQSDDVLSKVEKHFFDVDTFLQETYAVDYRQEVQAG